MATTKVIDLPILIPGMPLELAGGSVYTLTETDVAVELDADSRVQDVYQNLDTLRNFCTDPALIIVPLNAEAAGVLERERGLHADCFGVTFPG